MQTKPKLNGRRNQCCQCHKMFNSVAAFDAHRAGSFGFYIGKGFAYTPAARRCLSEEEMLAAGMLKNAAGFWISSEMPKLFKDKQ